jgi:hypothetical protein
MFFVVVLCSFSMLFFFLFNFFSEMSESESAISPVIKNKAGRKPKEVWSFFTTTGEKKEGHQGCKCKYCPWSQTRGEPNSMEAHLAVSCHKVPNDIKEKFLLIVKTRGEKRTFQLDAEVSVLQTKKRKAGHQQLITKYGESDIIENAKQQICDRAVAKFFICCGVSFRLVEHPFFIDMVKSLCLGYNPPSANVLSNDFLYAELANVIVDQHLELKSTRNLTLGNIKYNFFLLIFVINLLIIILKLGFDGWTSPLGQSLYAFVIMTPERKEIIHCIKNLSANSHTATFLADQLDEVITEVGAEKFAAVVSDHASACAAAKRIIAERHNHILPIRCIAHHVNLISTDICKTTFAKEVISKCQKVVKYFKQSHQAGEELRVKLNEIKGGGLKTYVVTRWTTAWDCTNSILRLEQALKNVRKNICVCIFVLYIRLLFFFFFFLMI